MCVDALKKYFFSMKNGYGNFWARNLNVFENSASDFPYTHYFLKINLKLCEFVWVQ